mgnify:CR=1 FL=1
MNSLGEEEGVSRLKLFAPPLVQIPIFLAFNRGIREISLYVPSSSPSDQLNASTLAQMNDLFTNSGILHIPSLTSPDPLCVLPLLATTLIYTSLEISLRESKVSWLLSFKSLAQSGIIIFMPFLAQLPAASQLYLATTSSLGIAQSVFFKNDKCRKLVGLKGVGGGDSNLEEDRKEFNRRQVNE